eukprot:5853203-Amphidinium_carterae.1
MSMTEKERISADQILQEFLSVRLIPVRSEAKRCMLYSPPITHGIWEDWCGSAAHPAGTRVPFRANPQGGIISSPKPPLRPIQQESKYSSLVHVSK